MLYHHSKNVEYIASRKRSKKLILVGIAMLLMGTQSYSNETVNEPEATSTGVLSDRAEVVRSGDAFNPYLFSTHKPNYIMPISYSNRIHSEVYSVVDDSVSTELKSEEVYFQFSARFPLNSGKLLFDNDYLYLGITIETWWQLYSKALSSPIRETNYEPEIFYVVPLKRKLWGGLNKAVIGFEHQSNGQIQGISRSWNRLYAGLLYEQSSYFALVRSWYRIPESPKKDLLGPRGDDNPDIHR